MKTIGRLIVPALALTLWGLVVLLVGALVGVGESAGQAVNHAGLVLAFPDGRVETYCVGFEGDEISGAELLRRSGVSVVFSGTGGLGEGVCRIDDTGCSDPGNCFCQCSGADCSYWSYFTMNDAGEWRYRNTGASQRMLRNGDVDAWVWGSGRAPPPAAELSGACAQQHEPAPPTAAPRAGPTEPAPGRPTAMDPAAEGTAIDVPANNEVASSTLVDAREPTAPAPDDVRSEVERETEAVKEPQAADLADETGDGGGLPSGLIAFGIVVVVLVAAVGGVAFRRRGSG